MATEAGPLYRMAPVAMISTFIGAVPLGIARHALDEFVALSQSKLPVLSQDVLADKPVANSKVGRAKALIESGHAYVRGLLAEQWAAVGGGHRPTMADRGALWLASSHAGQTALEAIELLYNNEVAGRLASGRVDVTKASHWTMDYRGEGIA